MDAIKSEDSDGDIKMDRGAEDTETNGTVPAQDKQKSEAAIDVDVDGEAGNGSS